LCDRADYGCTEGTGYRGQGVWGANYGRTGHNCTSYVSYRIAQLGVAQPWRPMGNANRWDDNARGGAVVDDVPAVGAVAQWEGGTRLAPGPLGHVAYVEAVTADGIELTDDTSGGRTRRYRIQRGSPYWPDDFVHIHDVGPPHAVRTGAWALTNASQPPLADALELDFGTSGDIPVVGDWDGGGTDTVGVFRDGTWVLTTTHVGDEPPTRTLRFGQAGDVPVVGDWDGDGKDTVGLFRDGTWILSSSLASDPPTPTVVQLGAAGDVPVVGDWDGDGDDTVGVFRAGAWTLSDAPGGAKRSVDVRFGAVGDRPISGDWNGTGRTTIGIFRDGTWVLPLANDALDGELSLLVLGTAETIPIVGDWDGRRGDTIGVAL
ncbi:MAG TPA: CHAP domain-containing protein, partial [Acidimicrobiales bacterium]|nr:CHAP domain-containing protein [Acidimicrobiales bacterium]